MKNSQGMALGAILGFALALTPSATAGPIGAISFGYGPGGGMFIRSSGIDFFLPVDGGFADVFTGGGSINYSGGAVTALTNPYSQLKDTSAAALLGLPGTPIANFIQFYTGPFLPAPLLAAPVFDLIGVGPPAAIDCATNPGVNVPCSVHVFANAGFNGLPAYISPFVLTLNANGNTDVRLDMLLLGKDTNGSTPFSGLLTTLLTNKTPAQVAAIINAGGWADSVSFTVEIQSEGSSSIPEPTTVLLSVTGISLIALRRRSHK